MTTPRCYILSDRAATRNQQGRLIGLANHSAVPASFTYARTLSLPSRGLEQLEPAEWEQQLQGECDRYSGGYGTRPRLCLIHGYANTLESSLKAARGLITYFNCPLICISWSSGGSVAAYRHDQKKIPAAVSLSQELFRRMQGSALKPRVIAHSMGAEIATRSIDELGMLNYFRNPTAPLTQEQTARADESHLALVAGDVDMQDMHDRLDNLTRRTIVHVYVSKEDMALWTSGCWPGHSQDRLGMSRSLKLRAHEHQYETIYLKHPKVDRIGHNYLSDAIFRRDLQLAFEGRPPWARLQMVASTTPRSKKSTEQPATYWRLECRV